MKVSVTPAVVLVLCCLTLTGCHESEAEQLAGEGHAEERKIVVTSPQKRDVVITEPYVCQIHSRRHIEVCALEGGYLEAIPVKEGQAVKQGDLLFKILPTLYQAKLDSEVAEAQLAQIEFTNTEKLFKQNVVSQQEVALAQAKLAKAQAMVKLTRAELNFADIKAPFDGIIDRLHHQQGSLIEEGDVLTTMSDNEVMWVYFNVPEARYLEYKADLDRKSKKQRAQHEDDDDDDDGDEDDEHEDFDYRDHLKDHDDIVTNQDDLQIELVLANGDKFPQPGKISAIEADFNNETGNIAFRADFPNPDGLLRHGQTGNILIHRTLKDAIVIPQRVTFEILDKLYVYVVDKDHVAHQRPITVQNEKDDIFVIESGLDVNDQIVFEGVRQIHDGEKVDFEFCKPEEALANQKFHAE